MANRIGARKNSAFRAVSTAPSFNKTPVGNATPPLPYATFQDLSNSVGVVPTVRFNGDPVYVLHKTTQPSGKGDAPGVAKGVKSGTVTGEVKPTKGSGTVNVGGRPAVRDGDPCTMNGGNNPGLFCTTQAPSDAPPGSAAKTSSPPAAAQTPAEQSMWQKAVESVKAVAKKYKDNISDFAHEAAAKAGDTGDALIIGGGGSVVVGGAAVLTGVGAIPGGLAVAGGGIAAAVGAGVTTVATTVETVATGLDVAAEVATTGQLPDMATVATAYAERVAGRRIDKIFKYIPGMKKGPAPKPDVKPPKIEPKVETGPAKTEGKVDAKKDDKLDTKKDIPGKKETEDNKAPAPAGDGVRVRRRRRDGDRCRLRPHSEGCPSGTPHHVVPDHCFKQPGRKSPYYPGGIERKDGLCICVIGTHQCEAPDGSDISKGKMSDAEHFDLLAQHGQIHVLINASEKALGLAGNPKYTTTLGQLEDAGSAAVARVTGCDKEHLKEQLRTYHQENGLDPDTKWRADPSGNTKGGRKLDPAKMGKMTPRGGLGGD